MLEEDKIDCLIAVPEVHWRTLVTVGRIYLEAFAPDEKMSMTELFAVQRVEEAIEWSKGDSGE